MTILAILVTGARGSAVPRELVDETLDLVNPDELILGDCPSGVDLYAYEWWQRQPANKVQLHMHYADWDRYGAAAGPRRNGAMVACALERRAIDREVFVVAFPRGGPGTQDCMAQAKAAGLHVELF